MTVTSDLLTSKAHLKVTSVVMNSWPNLNFVRLAVGSWVTNRGEMIICHFASSQKWLCRRTLRVRRSWRLSDWMEREKESRCCDVYRPWSVRCRHGRHTAATMASDLRIRKINECFIAALRHGTISRALRIALSRRRRPGDRPSAERAPGQFDAGGAVHCTGNWFIRCCRARACVPIAPDWRMQSGRRERRVIRLCNGVGAAAGHRVGRVAVKSYHRSQRVTA